MKAWHSALLTSSAHLTKMVMGFIILKLIALYLGPSGLGNLGHFMSVVSLVVVLAGGGIVTGVIKYVADLRRKPRAMLEFLSASAVYSLSASAIILFFGAVFSKDISSFLFNDPKLYWLVIILALAQLGFAFSNLMIGVCNGLGDTKTFAKIQMFGNILSLPISWFLIVGYGFEGAALAIVASFVINIVPALYFYLKSSFFKRVLFRSSFDMSNIKMLIPFSCMMIFSAVILPVVEITVREFIIQYHGYEDAGIWQASIRLSNAYVGFFGVFLAYYFMPTISIMTDTNKILASIKQMALIITAVYFVGAGALYVGRSFFVPLFLSAEFQPLEELIVYQLVGDYFKILSYVLAYVCVAKAAFKAYISAEILQAFLFLLAVYVFGYLAESFVGVFWGYSLAYMVYFVVFSLYFRFYLLHRLV